MDLSKACPNCGSTIFTTSEKKMKRTTGPKKQKTHPFYKGPLMSYGYFYVEITCNSCNNTWEKKIND